MPNETLHIELIDHTHTDGDPHEAAAAQVDQLNEIIGVAIRQAELVELGTRNAVMTEILSDGPLGRAVRNRARATNESGATDPYQQWIETDAAAMVTRLQGALKTVSKIAADLAQRLEEPQ